MPAPTLIIKATVATILLMPRERKIGSTITPIAMTAPAPNTDEKIAVVTMQIRMHVSHGLSPPSSVVVRMRLDAMPVRISTRPNHAPKQTLTSTEPQPSGPDWNTFFSASPHEV